MKVRNCNFALRIIGAAMALGLFAAGSAYALMGGGYSTPSAPSNPSQMPDNQQPRQNGKPAAPAAPKVDPAEEKAYKAFNTAPDSDVDAKIKMGEQFDQKYPNSKYDETVQTTLVNLYYSKQDWDKFNAMASKVIAKDPDNISVLALVGWILPRKYDPNDPNAAANLDKSEKYEKHALDLIGTMPKPPQMTDDQFTKEKENAAGQAHSGLGMTYFRRQDYDDSAKELKLATDGTAQLDPADLYILGVDLQKLGKNADAADAFTKCSQQPGALQDRCKQSADAARQAK